MIMSFISCNHKHTTIFFKNKHKIIYKQEQCDEYGSFPQMIVIPYFEKATQVVPNCNTYPVNKTAFAMIIFYHQWLEYFEDNNMAVRGMLENVMIEWGVEKKIVKEAYSVTGEKVKDARVIGLARGGNMMWVWQGYNGRISETSFVHELVHLALRAKNGSGDSDHEGSKYKGWTRAHTNLIVETKNMLRAFEI